MGYQVFTLLHNSAFDVPLIVYVRKWMQSSDVIPEHGRGGCIGSRCVGGEYVVRKIRNANL